MKTIDYLNGKDLSFFIGFPENAVIKFFESLGFEHDQPCNDYVFRLIHKDLSITIVCHVDMDPDKGVIVDQIDYSK